MFFRGKSRYFIKKITQEVFNMLAQQLLNGILLGSMYALLAISFTLVLGVLNMLNLAQGEILTAISGITAQPSAPLN